MDEKATKTKEIVEKVLSLLGVAADVEVAPKDHSLVIEITNTESGLLIGYQGETLRSLQHIIRLMVFSELGEETPAVVVDVEGYRKQEEEKLRVYVQKLANLVKENNQEEVLKPMSSYKRRLIHTFVEEIPGVTTESRGEEQDRRIVIKPE